MRKKILYITLFSVASFFSSCTENIENWNPETADFTGRFVVKTLSEDMTTVTHDYDGSEVSIFNTAANTANEVWIQDEEHLEDLHSKFTLSGSSASFSSENNSFAALPNNVETTSAPSTAPTAANQTTSVDRDDIRAAIIEGKILEKAAKSIGGNATDSLYLKVQYYGGTLNFKSMETPSDQWTDPNVPEYKWEFDSATEITARNRVFVIAGYRYTGFPEDAF